MKFCRNMFLDNRAKPREFQSHRSKVNVTGFSVFFVIARWGKKFVRTITHEPLHLAGWHFSRTCTLTTVRTLLNIKVIGHFLLVNRRSPNCFYRTWKKIVIDDALSIVWSVPEIFTTKVCSCPKSSALSITHEPLHLASWNFARTCISTTSRA